MFVRWLGAFGNATSLEDSLEHELSLTNREVACEVIKGRTSLISHAKVGLQVSHTCVIKKFNGDCWSTKQRISTEGLVANPKTQKVETQVFDKELRKNRNPKKTYSSHKEAWALTPCYKSIQVKRMKTVSEAALTTVFEIAKKYSLPVYEFETGRRLN